MFQEQYIYISTSNSGLSTSTKITIKCSHRFKNGHIYFEKQNCLHFKLLPNLYGNCCNFILSEVHKAVQNAKALYQRWCELLSDPNNCTREEYDWTTNELRNSLRSIEWDLEDLEETISILKYKLNNWYNVY